MASVSLERITKVYPNGFQAVSELSLDVADGEFMVLVGPSGCGKTTALRMVAGLEGITHGTLRVDGKVVNDASPRDRDVAMVFQNYALYPHMTVAENIGFALKLRKMPKDDLRAKVVEAAEILGLTDQLDRKPGQLSGGQRQRVAMGRAIVREPAVFLMDEPLSNLDAKLRVQMRAEIARVQRRIGVATFYVTHDQVEAMTMGDRVAVLRGGVLQQCGPPQGLYDHPDNLFVAAFIGSPAMNLYQAAVSADGRQLLLGSQALAVPEALRLARPGLDRYHDRPVVVGIRPENLSDGSLTDHSGATDDAGSAGSSLIGEVELVEALGSELVVHFRIDARRVQAEDALAGAAHDPTSEAGDGRTVEVASPLGISEGVARVDPRSGVKPGQRAMFSVATDRIHLFDPDTGMAVWD
jgi:multiple sugar transport system ATP-binding protein